MLAHQCLEAVGGLVDEGRDRARIDVEPELDAGARRGGLDAQSDGGRGGVGVVLEHLECLAGPRRTFDVDDGGRPERDVDAVVGRKRGLDHFLLHLPVERHRDLAQRVVLPHGDERVLLGEVGERGAERTSLAGRGRLDDRFERWRREVMTLGTRWRRADGVADSEVGEPPDLRDLAGRHHAPSDRA